MKGNALTLGLLIVTGFLFSEVHTQKPSFAKCVQADISVQYNVSGSQKPSRQTNDVVMESERGCRGNVSVTTGVQGNVGGQAPVEQHRRVRHRQSGSSSGKGSPVQVQSNPTIDVFNTAEQYR